MKAMRSIGIFSLLAAFCLLSVLSVNTASAEPIEISYANLFPPTHIQSQLPESWCKEVEKRTNGKVKITYYPGGTLLKGPKIFSGVLDGIADMGNSVQILGPFKRDPKSAPNCPCLRCRPELR